MLGQFWRSPFRTLSLFCLCLLLVVSCGRSSPEVGRTPPGSRDRIVLGTTAQLSTIDPADAYSSFAGALLYNLGDRLYSYKLGTTDLVPQLAIALPSVSADGLTYKIALRQGVVFHDGTPFDAAAMAFSLNRFIQNAGSPAFLLSDLVDSVQASTQYELTIKLKKSFAAFPSLLAFSGAAAVSPKAYEIKEGSFKPDQFVGTGPYKLVRLGTDQIQLDAFEQYWGEKPANRGIDIQVFSSSANLFNAFRTGAIDVAYQSLALEQIRSLQRDLTTAGWQILEKSGSGIDYLTLNLKSPPLDKLEVRQAIAAMIDRPLLQERVFQGQIDPLYSLIPTTISEQEPIFQQEYGDRNSAKARELLTKAGYSLENPLQVEFWYRSNVTNDQLAAITLKAIVNKQLNGLMQLQLNSVESTTAYKNLDKGAYPMFLLDWSADFFDADNYIQPFMECAKGSEKTGCEEGASFGQGSYYYSDRANQLIDQSRKAQDPTTRKQIFAEIQTLLGQDVPFIPLWQSKDFLFVQKWIQGASLEVTQKAPFWTLQKSA
ncbi:ABC transporter substrate-binding protein [Pantanalinema sp. GBBB05]|uniref:ABC transporter substrate-binding protein n=1 Tax=Pantanalinema sp. GBBB05 TaxID=2604139 RepID=UPI001DEAAB77|nr:peptide ABC transporter substrate-binding protein [Pantanalinema sp. GBBB05]